MLRSKIKPKIKITINNKMMLKSLIIRRPMNKYLAK